MPHGPCSGFSLIEALVAILVGAVVMTAVTQFFSFQLASMRVERERRSAQMTARTALAFITRQLEHIGRDPQRSLFANVDDTTLPPAIEAAGGDSIHYLTNLSEGLTDGDTTDAWEDVTFSRSNGCRSAQAGGEPPLTDGTTSSHACRRRSDVHLLRRSR
jgi:prepilin-type N-terminal cleavage/methylation domain-containing protein